MRCKEILGIARRCADKCADINIPVSFFQQFQMICRALDLYFNSDFLQRCLCTLREKRQFLAARIREPADGQAFSVFFHVAVAVLIGPACFSQQFSGILKIIGLLLHFAVAECKVRGERAFRHASVSFHQRIHKALPVDRSDDCLAHAVVLQHPG